jgi:hypothetical protein
MNKTEIAEQVRTTLGDHVEDFDVDAIVEDLAQANGNALSVDDFASESYWAIVETHDRTIRGA